MRARPFLRLTWSPQAGFLVLPLILAAAWPMIRTHPVVAGLAGSIGEGQGSILWGHGVTFSLVAGFMSGLITRDLLQAPFAFVVPGLTRKVFLGKLTLSIVIGGGLAVWLAAIAGSVTAPAIFACSLLFFFTGSALSDPVFPKAVIWIVAPLLVIPVMQPGRVAVFFETAPVIATLGALAIAVILCARELDRDTARLRTLGRMGMGPAESEWVTTLRRIIAPSDRWESRPVTGHVGAWVHAVHYESFGSRRFEWPVTVTWAVLLNCVMAYLLANPSFAAVMGLMSLSIGGHRLNGRWTYPISRDRRAVVLWLSSLLDSGAYVTGAMIALPLIYALGAPQLSVSTGGTMRYGLIAPLLVAFIVAPLVQWPRVTSALPPPRLKRFGALWLSISFRNLAAVTLLTFMLESLFVVRQYLGMSAAIATGLVLGLAFQYYYWVNLRHHFLTADLT